MAWTAPATWAVSEVVLASKMNTHVRDNLNYLKGNAGAVVISDRLSVPTTNAVAAAGFRHAGASGDVTTLQGYDSGGVSALIMGINRYYDGGFLSFNTRAGSVFQITDNAFSYNAFAASSNVAIPRWVIDANGNMGIGTTTPEGVFHAIRTSTGGGIMFLSATAVGAGLQTLAAAATVTQFALIYTIDRNNTGGAVVTRVGGDALVLGGTYTYTNTDNVTVTLTAGGAITVQRVSGTTNHEVELLVIYK